MRNSDDEQKWLPAGRLSDLLQQVPPDSRVMVNRAGDLLICSMDGSKTLARIVFLFGGGVVPME